MSPARCTAGRLGGIPACRPSDDIAGHVAGRRDAPLVRRRCVRASAVSKVRTQGVRTRSGAIACRCCGRIAPIATWRESTALKLCPSRGSLARIQRFAVRAAVDDRLCAVSAGGSDHGRQLRESANRDYTAPHPGRTTVNLRPSCARPRAKGFSPGRSRAPIRLEPTLGGF